MDRIWQWAWNRYGARYSWAVYAISAVVALFAYLFWSFLLVTVAESANYVEAAAVTIVAVLVQTYAFILAGVGRIRLVEQWARGSNIDIKKPMEATYAYAREAVARAVVCGGVLPAVIFVVVGATAGATWWRIIQYAILGVVVGISNVLIAVH